MQVTIRLFASARDAAGWERQVLDLPEGATIASARQKLRGIIPDATPLLDSAAFALNQRYARADDRLTDGDELAILPPVSGG